MWFHILVMVVAGCSGWAAWEGGCGLLSVVIVGCEGRRPETIKEAGEEESGEAIR
jgi:hypothetical protein